MAKFLDIEGLKTLWEKTKSKFASKAELDNNYSSLDKEIKKIKIEVGALPSPSYINNQIRNIATFNLTFSPPSGLPSGVDLNRYTTGAHIYDLDGKYTNSPLDGQIIYGSMINLVRYAENIYVNKENTQFIYQFILLSSGRIFNRTRWNGNWNAWKEIERVNPKL